MISARPHLSDLSLLASMRLVDRPAKQGIERGRTMQGQRLFLAGLGEGNTIKASALPVDAQQPIFHSNIWCMLAKFCHSVSPFCSRYVLIEKKSYEQGAESTGAGKEIVDTGPVLDRQVRAEPSLGLHWNWGRASARPLFSCAS